MKNIAIITARGGSKRIPRKNIKDFCGKPIIAYSIEAALNSKIFDEVMVSTDDEEIKEVAIKYGAKVPFMRSEKTSNDYATTRDVLLEVIDEYKKIGITFDEFACIYPTAPFITSKVLNDAYTEFKNSDASGLMPAVKFSFPPQRGVVERNGYIIAFSQEDFIKRSQDLEKIYHDAGQFYFYKTNEFVDSKSHIINKTIIFELEEKNVQDIDTIDDWEMAEIKYKLYKKS